jgi:cysteine desulfurase/selenocysteine lyase
LSIRSDFPILARQSRGKSLVYLDNGATTQKPQVVIDAIDKYYQQHNSNVHRAAHELAEEATQMMESGRSLCQAFINAESRKEIIFTRGTTEAINLVANVLTQRIKPGQDILITELEHHSNIVPWQMLAERTGANIKAVAITDDGELDLNDAAAKLTKNTALFAFTHVSKWRKT